jgi:hypothetical protein
MVTPKRSEITYTVKGNARSESDGNMLAAMPSAAFCKVPPNTPANTRQTTRVAKFLARACGTRKMQNRIK